MSTTVKYSGDRAERLLSCCVPNLKLHYFVSNIHYKCTKLHSDCHLVLNLKVIVHYSC